MQMQEMKTEPYLHPAQANQMLMGEEATVRIPVPQVERSRRPRWLLLATILWLFLALATAVFGVVGFSYFSDWILPGVTVMDVPVGMMTQAEAKTVLQDEWVEQPVVLYAETGQWAVTPAEIGVLLDVETTIATAYKTGRTFDSWVHLGQKRSATMSPIISWDTAVAETAIVQLKQQLDQPALDATVTIENGVAVAVPAVAGQTVDVQQTMNVWQTMQTFPQDGRLPLHIQPIQPTIIDVSDLVAQANALLVTTFTVDAYDPVRHETVQWEIAPAIWGEWLSLRPSADPILHVEWVVDEQLAAAYFAEQADLLGNGRYINEAEFVKALQQAIHSDQIAISLRLFHHPSQHIVQAGESLASIGFDYGIPYPWLQQANPTVTALSVGQAINIPSPDDLLPYPIVKNKRIVASINQQKAWVYENDQLIWEWSISTGIADSPTAPGVFQIQTHVENAYAANWNLWMPNFMGIYRPVPTSDFMNGFHGFPTRDGANLLWTQNLGTPVTYGCILLSNENAAILYEWAEQGVVVEIQP